MTLRSLEQFQADSEVQTNGFGVQGKVLGATSNDVMDIVLPKRQLIKDRGFLR